MERKREDLDTGLEYTLDRICFGVRELGGNAPVKELSTKTGVNEKTIYYHTKKRLRIQLDGNGAVTWTPVERAIQSLEGTYVYPDALGDVKGPGFAAFTDPEIQLAKIAGLMAVDVKDSEQIGELRGALYLHLKDLRRRVDANTDAFHKSRKRENENEFLRSLPEKLPPSP